MPLFPLGSLTDSLSKLTAKAQKVTIAHGILTAVAHLHENSILHRDIKGDNILLLESTAATGNDVFLQPVLIDFSLAKVVDPNVVIPGGSLKLPSVSETETTHTPGIGTPTYRAPEVLEEQEYSFPSDLWSVGVVLLELLRGRCLEATKDKGAIALIADSLQALPEDQPFPNLIRSLLETDPAKRLTARQALEFPLFSKYGLKVDPNITFRRLNIHKAVPFENESDEEEKENDASSRKNSKSNTSHKTQKKKRVDPVLAKRFQTIRRVSTAMGWNHPVTAQAALCYSIQMSELCDVDDLNESPQALLDCVVLAHKFFERDFTDLKELPSLHSLFAKWDLDEYVDSESTLFMMMDFCLYPRQFLLLV
jgi:serine/threonine protein kinase